MNAERLIKHFDRIAEAPGAVPRLRRFILDLALRGRLVPQDKRDEPATKLLARIQGDQLLKRGIDRRSVHRVRQNCDDVDVPVGWCLATVADLCVSVTDGDHQPPPKATTGIPFLVIGNVRTKSIEFDNCRFVSEEYFHSLDESRRPKFGDLLFTLVGSYGIPVLVSSERPFCVQRHIAILRPSPNIDVEFLARAFESSFVFSQASACATGIAQKTVPLTGLRRIWVPLPPLAEQRRIVAKVDELMALCDRLEVAQRRREDARDRLVDAYEAKSRTGSYTSSLDALEVSSRHVAGLRRCVLNLGVRGRLTFRKSSDEAPAELIARIQAEKQEALPPRKRPGVTGNGMDSLGGPFDVPSAWRWVRTEDIAGRISDGVHKKPSYVASGIPFLTVKNLTEGSGISFRETRFVAEADHAGFIKRTHPERGDVLITKDGTIGVSRIVDTDRPFSIFVSVALVKMIEKRLGPFLVLCFNSDLVRSSIVPKGAALKHLHLIDLRNLLVPLPPLEEQERIVAKVDELMTLCDRLEAQLALFERESGRFLEAVLREVLADDDATRSGPSSSTGSGGVASRDR